MKSLVFALFLCITWRKIETSLSPSIAIAPCLVPPFRNLVYNYEVSIKTRPGVRTGCYVQADSDGSPILWATLFPLKTAIPLQYYIVDATGQRKTVLENGSVTLELQDENNNNITHSKIFKFDQICFPILCYSSFKTYGHSCSSFLAQAQNTEPTETSNIQHLGREMELAALHDTWLYCKAHDNQHIIPIMSSESPFGQLQNLTRIPGFPDITGPRILLSISHRELRSDLRSGCEVMFPLTAPFNKYSYRFWYEDKDRNLSTIAKGQTGFVERVVSKFDCEAYTSEFGERACTEGTWVEEFQFDDFCFPPECYIQKKQNCTGKDGVPKKAVKSYSVVWYSGIPEHSFLLNLSTAVIHP